MNEFSESEKEKYRKSNNPWSDGKDGFSITLSKSSLIEIKKEHNMSPNQLVNFVMGSIRESISPMIKKMLLEEENK